MLFVIFQALFFFLPAYAANAAPVLLDRLRAFTFLAVPVDFNIKLAGNPLFGVTKTWRGIIGGAAAALIIVFIQGLLLFIFPSWSDLFICSYRFPDVLLLGLYMGFGEGVGDLIKSFIKRRLNIKSSAPFFPFDQMSFLGAVFLSQLYVQTPVYHLVAICLISPLIPVIANIAAYKLGWKKVWW